MRRARIGVLASRVPSRAAVSSRRRYGVVMSWVHANGEIRATMADGSVVVVRRPRGGHYALPFPRQSELLNEAVAEGIITAEDYARLMP